MWSKLDIGTREAIGALIVTVVWMALARVSTNPEFFWMAGIFFVLMRITFRIDR